MSGCTTIGGIQAGETVVISAAAGGVGSVAGQIARLRGCRVVGLVGSADKAAVVKDRLGFDEVINYREVPDLAAAVAQACPDGVDLYYDNVGGPTLDAMLVNMKSFGRIVACGMMAGYNQQDEPPPVRHLWEVVARQLRMQGFLLPFFPDVDSRRARRAARVGAFRRAAGPGERHARPPSRARGVLRPDGRQHGRQDPARARRDRPAPPGRGDPGGAGQLSCGTRTAAAMRAAAARPSAIACAARRGTIASPMASTSGAAHFGVRARAALAGDDDAVALEEARSA